MSAGMVAYRDERSLRQLIQQFRIPKQIVYLPVIEHCSCEIRSPVHRIAVIEGIQFIHPHKLHQFACKPLPAPAPEEGAHLREFFCCQQRHQRRLLSGSIAQEHSVET